MPVNITIPRGARVVVVQRGLGGVGVRGVTMTPAAGPPGTTFALRTVHPEGADPSHHRMLFPNVEEAIGEPGIPAEAVGVPLVHEAWGFSFTMPTTAARGTYRMVTAVGSWSFRIT